MVRLVGSRHTLMVTHLGAEILPCNSLPTTSVVVANLEECAAADAKHANADVVSLESVDGSVTSIRAEERFAVSRAVNNTIRKQDAGGAASFEKRLHPHELKAWLNAIAHRRRKRAFARRSTGLKRIKIVVRRCVLDDLLKSD